MMGAKLALLVLLGQLPASGPAELVGRLGSSRYLEREAASDALERLGRAALPALRAARGARDLEIRTRAAALVSRIEGALLTQPTLITLDFQDQPLDQVLKALSDQAGIQLTIPENVPGLLRQRITLREPVPVPFWTAIDRLCEAAHLHHGAHASPRGREPVFPLFVNGPHAAGPISDSGPFRVSLVSLHYQRDVVFVTPLGERRGEVQVAAPGPSPAHAKEPGFTINAQFYAQVQVAAEPRLSLSLNGPLRVLEAVDDRGQSLLAPGDGPVTQRVSGYFGLIPGSTAQVQVPLKRPEPAGTMIRTFRGVIPVTVATRKPDPLVVPLSNGSGKASAPGKSFQNDEVFLEVHDVRTDPNTNQSHIDLSIRARGGPGGAADTPPGSGGEFLIHRPDMHQQQIEVVDAQGRPIPWFQSSLDGEGTRITLTLIPSNQGPPAEIRYYGLARAATEVGFEFHDVPMP